MTFKPFAEWLYNNSPSVRRTIDNMIPKGAREAWDREVSYWSSPRGEYELQSFATGLPLGIGDFIYSLMHHKDAMSEMDEALDLYGLDYDDIKYPTKTLGFRTGGSFVSAGVNFFSSNIGRLYK